MSADHTDLLERATPRDVPRLDYEGLARRGRRRRHARRAGGVTAAVALVAAASVAIGGLRDPAPIEVAGGDTAPGTAEASAIGEWSQTFELTSGRNDAFADTASDGRLVVYGGTQGLDGRAAHDGLVVDPATGASTPIPAPPVSDRPFPGVALAGDRLLVFGGNDGSPDGAHYDLASESWTAIPPVPSGDVAPNVRAWDGTTLIVGDTYRMSETALGNLELWQWQVGDQTWTPLPDSPLDAGDVRTAFGDGHLAAATDGPTRLAVYDVAAGEWTAVASEDIPDGDRLALSWQDGGLVVVGLPSQVSGRTGSDDRGTPIEVARPVRFAPDTWAPTTLSPLPDELQRSVLRIDVGVGPDVTPSGAPLMAAVGTEASALLSDGTWTTPVAADRIVGIGDALVALESPWTVDAPLAAHVWTEGVWRSATSPAMDARGWAATAVGGNTMYVVGGASMRSPEPGEEPDASPSEDGEAGPYVTEIHTDVVQFSLDES